MPYSWRTLNADRIFSNWRTVISTSGMIRHASESNHIDLYRRNGVGLLYPLKKANPDKVFFPASEKMICKDMKKITLEDIVRSLENMEGEVKVPEEIRKPALGRWKE